MLMVHADLYILVNLHSGRTEVNALWMLGAPEHIKRRGMM